MCLKLTLQEKVGFPVEKPKNNNLELSNLMGTFTPQFGQRFKKKDLHKMAVFSNDIIREAWKQLITVSCKKSMHRTKTASDILTMNDSIFEDKTMSILPGT